MHNCDRSEAETGKIYIPLIGIQVSSPNANVVKFDDLCFCHLERGEASFDFYDLGSSSDVKVHFHTVAASFVDEPDSERSNTRDEYVLL